MKWKFSKLMSRTLCLATALLFAACGGNVGPASTNPAVSVTISHAAASLWTGDTTTFRGACPNDSPISCGACRNILTGKSELSD